jgi:hypothetical protein
MRFLHTTDHPIRELYSYDELHLEPLPGSEPPHKQKLY